MLYSPQLAVYADSEILYDPEGEEQDEAQKAERKEFLMRYKDVLNEGENDEIKDEPLFRKVKEYKVKDFNVGDSTSDDDKDSQSSVKKMRKAVTEHQQTSELRVHLQKILGDLIKKDHSAIQTLQNHAKTISGIIGAEFQFFQDKRPLAEKLEEEKMFYDDNILKYYDVRFVQIEKTPLGKQITEQIRNLEERERGLKTSILDMKAEHKMREQ